MSGSTRSKANMSKPHVDTETSTRVLTEAYLESALEKFFKRAEDKSKERFERLEEQLGSIKDTLSQHAIEIESQRAAVSSIDTRVQKNEATLEKLADSLMQMELKLVSLEDRSRRDNIRILNVKEGEERGNMLSYLTANLLKWLPGLAAAPPELMRAHRLGPPRQGSSPRAIIVKCLRFTDRDRILNEARKTPVQLSGKPLRFVADYSDATSKRRRPCYPVMYQARSAGFNAFLIYPATIKLEKGGEHHLFENPSDAVEFISKQ